MADLQLHSPIQHFSQGGFESGFLFPFPTTKTYLQEYAPIEKITNRQDTNVTSSKNNWEETQKRKPNMLYTMNNLKHVDK